MLAKHIAQSDVVISTAAIPGKPSPKIISKEMVKNMRPGSVVFDMAVEFGGNCEASEKGKNVKKHGVTIIGEPNLPSLVPTHSSEMYAKNILSLIQHIGKEGNIELSLEDEIVQGSLITHNGAVYNQRIKDLLK